MSDNTIRVGLLGCGTVGTGVLRILKENRADIVARLGADIEVVKILVNDTDKPRDPVVPQALLTTDPEDVLAADAQVIVEVMGGYEPARTLLLDALDRGRHVVTANKALLARHGAEIFRKADESHRDVIFEASVGGGIPIIRTLREGLASDRISSIHGIINGTSNYVLTAMAKNGQGYADAVADAQAKGYAEADPHMDVAGIDAAQKLSILVSISFGLEIPFETIRTEGIERVTAADIHFADQFGYAIKPLGVAKAHDDGIEARVHPTLIPKESLLGNVHGVFNAVMVHSHALGPILFYGQGAGMMPTAASVVSDIIELGRNIQRGTSGRLPHLAFHPDLVSVRKQRDPALTECPFYLRFTVHDAPGVLARISGTLGEHAISIRRMVQEDTPQPDLPVPVVVLTHSAREGDILAALAKIDALDLVTEPTCYLRVEDGL
jgi:homoserine dehydrogenase